MGYNVGIIGYGGMGGWHHDSIAQHIPDMHVIGAYDINEEARIAAEKKGIIPYKTLNELIDNVDVDLVIIATPNNFHKDLAIIALNGGKHVICEKPVTLNSKELEEIMEVAKLSDRLFTIHQNRRWDKDYVIIKNIVESGVIGLPYFIESRVLGSRRFLYGWRNNKENGGGMVLDWGVHLIDQLLDLVPSKVVSVYAKLQRIFTREVDDNFKLMMTFENNVTAMIEVASNCFINQPRWHLNCIDGTAVIKNWECEGEIIKILSDVPMDWNTKMVWTPAGPTRTMAPRPANTIESIELPKIETDWTGYYKNIVAVLDGKAELIVKPEQVLRVMKLVDLIFESDEKGVGIRCYI